MPSALLACGAGSPFGLPNAARPTASPSPLLSRKRLQNFGISKLPKPENQITHNQTYLKITPNLILTQECIY